MDRALSQCIRIEILNPGSGYPDKSDPVAVFSSLTLNDMLGLVNKWIEP